MRFKEVRTYIKGCEHTGRTDSKPSNKSPHVEGRTGKLEWVMLGGSVNSHVAIGGALDYDTNDSDSRCEKKCRLYKLEAD